jgi:hypothetical protein
MRFLVENGHAEDSLFVTITFSAVILSQTKVRKRAEQSFTSAALKGTFMLKRYFDFKAAHNRRRTPKAHLIHIKRRQVVQGCTF